MSTKSDGASAIRMAYRELNPFVRVRLVTDLADVPRPFSVVFRAE